MTYQTELVAITGIPSSPLGRLSDLLIQVPTRPLPGSAEVVDRVVAIGLAEVLFQCLAARRPEILATSVRIDDVFGDDRL